MVYVTPGDWWVVWTNLAFLVPAYAAYKGHDYVRMVSFAAICGFSGGYHWCHDTELDRKREHHSNGCATLVTWRLAKADHILSYWLVACILLLLVPSVSRWDDAVFLPLALLFNILTAVVFVPIKPSESTDTEQMAQIAVIGSVMLAKMFVVHCCFHMDMDVRLKTLWAQMGHCAIVYAVVFVVLATLTFMLQLYTPWNDQPQHGIWHMATAVLATLVLIYAHPRN